MFEEEFENPRKMGVKRQNKIFDFLRTGYEAFSLSPAISETVAARVKALGVDEHSKVVAVQIRRGDKLAKEWKYHDGYIPLERYLSVSANQTVFVKEIRKNFFLPASNSSASSTDLVRIVSSDDAELWENPVVQSDKGIVRTQTGVVGHNGGMYNEDLLEMSDEEIRQLAVDYFVDFGVLTESLRVAEDGWAVCTSGADLCRMLAVGMGWDSAIEKGHWINIDGDFDWFGIRW